MATPYDAHLDAARALLEQELAAGGENDVANAAGRLYQRLHHSVSPVIGAGGVRAIFGRGAKLATAEFSGLGGVSFTIEIEAELVDVLHRLPPGERDRAAIRLFANFLGLLTSFIGEALTSRIVSSACPKVVGSGKETE